MNSNSNMTTSGQLKLTQNEIDYLQQFLKANDRGGYYLAFASFHRCTVGCQTGLYCLVTTLYAVILRNHIPHSCFLYLEKNQ